VWATRYHITHIVTPFAPQGPTRERLDAVSEALENEGMRLVMIRRPWDELLWPFATAGFFAFKEKIPTCLERLGHMA
jgi:deoxyribodipyrimidine photo-lyase